eukprot:gene7278-9920_t
MKRTNKNDIADVTGDGGILKEILVPGDGKLLDGTEFDSSRKRGIPFKFNLGRREVILGWDKGVQTMKKGEKCILTCKPDYAYGSRGIGPIPGNATLSFEVELLDWSDISSSEKDDGGSSMFYMVLVFLIAVIAIYSFFNYVYPLKAKQ